MSGLDDSIRYLVYLRNYLFDCGNTTSSTISLADDILQLMSRQSWTKKDTCLTLMSTTILHSTVNAHLPIRL